MHKSLSRPNSFMLTVGILACPAFMGGCGSTSDTPSMGPVCPAADDLISDFTMNNGIQAVDGRQGGWYTYADKSGLGTLTPMEGGTAAIDMNDGNPACSKAGSLRVKAVGFTDWGAAFGTDFKPQVTNAEGNKAKGTYDASKYKGVSFYAKATASAKTDTTDAINVPVKFVQVKFLDPYTERPSVQPMAEWCDYQATMPAINCSPYIVKFGYGFTPAETADYPKYLNTKIDDTWRKFEVLFADTKQDQFNPGKKSPGDHLDVTQLEGMAIQVNTDHSTTPPTANNFEISIDDVAFIKK